jgi:translation initiation factor 1
MSRHSKIVYSTDPNFVPDEPESLKEPTVTPHGPFLRLALDRKQRAGKSVTVIEGFSDPIEKIEALTKRLKSICASGGTVKDRRIELQGDHRTKVEKELVRQGYRVKRVGG